MNGIIVNYLEKQTCASVCSVNEEGKPWCFSCFYVFNSKEGLMYYKSSLDTRHSGVIKNNSFVSGTILPDKLNTLMVKGVQFEGVVLESGHPLAEHAATHYYKKNPMARAIPGQIWTIQLLHIKMTDSTLGFGKKITWSLTESVEAD